MNAYWDTQGMCGFAVICNLSGQPVSAATLERMTQSLVHRGPDDSGHYLDGSVGLGFRRLAILDLSPAGYQPMVSDDGRFVLVFNGADSRRKCNVFSQERGDPED
jgi:asparagine synthase (glutamine-hydrolysing)